jgi:hypothetical protein
MFLMSNIQYGMLFKSGDLMHLIKKFTDSYKQYLN